MYWVEAMWGAGILLASVLAVAGMWVERRLAARWRKNQARVVFRVNPARPTLAEINKAISTLVSLAVVESRRRRMGGDRFATVVVQAFDFTPQEILNKALDSVDV